MLLNLLFSIGVSISGKWSEMNLGQQPLHWCQVTYFQLQVIQEPQRERKKGCPESPTRCYTVLLGAELHLLSSLQSPEHPVWGGHLPGHAPAAPLAPWLHSPSPSTSVPAGSSKRSETGKSANTEHRKTVSDPPGLEKLVEIPMKQLLLWPFLPILGIASTAWALCLLILLRTSNFGPILPFWLKFFLFLRQRIQRNGMKLSP